MAKFDISAAASRFTGLEPRMRNESIRKELEPYTAAPQQPPEQTARIEPMSEYVRPPTEPAAIWRTSATITNRGMGGAQG
jgi:hypothetical protein